MSANDETTSVENPHRVSRAQRRGALGLWLLAIGLGVAVIVLSARRPGAGVQFVEVPNPLDLPVADVHLHGVPLQQAVAVLRERTGANIVVDWSDQREEDIRPQQPVDADLHAVTLRAALNATISQATSLYVLDVKDGVIHVHRPNAPGTFVTRTYDVRDLLAGEGPVMSTDGYTPEDRLVTCLQYVLGMNRGRFGTQASSVPTIDPGITTWGGRIVVYYDLEGQREIEQILAELRRRKGEARLLPSH